MNSNTLTFVWIAVIFVAFYFLLIRPQQKRAKEQQALLASLRSGQRIVTVGGLYGTIERVEGDIIELRISDGVVVEVNRSAIARHVDPEGHLLDDTEEEQIESGVGPVPDKPRSEDVEAPEVHVGQGDDEQAGQASGSGGDAKADAKDADAKDADAGDDATSAKKGQ